MAAKRAGGPNVAPTPGRILVRVPARFGMLAHTSLQICDAQSLFVPDLDTDGGAWRQALRTTDRKSTRLNSSHSQISYAVFCLKKKKMASSLSSNRSSCSLT